uniref:Putative ovule protein n=1 Tax=Solanum chacoense TaxID=4108 RepID=A0A0V0GS53_SOLCH
MTSDIYTLKLHINFGHIDMFGCTQLCYSTLSQYQERGQKANLKKKNSEVMLSLFNYQFQCFSSNCYKNVKWK